MASKRAISHAKKNQIEESFFSTWELIKYKLYILILQESAIVLENYSIVYTHVILIITFLYKIFTTMCNIIFISQCKLHQIVIKNLFPIKMFNIEKCKY